MFQSFNHESWNNRSVVVLSPFNGVATTYRQLLEPFKWRLETVTEDSEKALQLIKEAKASCIIIDSDFNKPAAIFLKEILSDPIGVITPILCSLEEGNEGDLFAINKTGSCTILLKPLSGANFKNSFTALLRKWESKQFLLLRSVVQNALKRPGLDSNLLTTFKKMLVLKDIHPIVCTSSALFLIKKGEYKAAEQYLFAAIKENPSNLIPYLSLGSFYLTKSLPSLALKLFLTILNKHSTCLFLLTDLTETYIFLHQFDQAILMLEKLIDKSYLLKKTEMLYIKLLIITGDSRKARKILNNRLELYKVLNDSLTLNKPHAA